MCPIFRDKRASTLSSSDNGGKTISDPRMTDSWTWRERRGAAARAIRIVRHVSNCLLPLQFLAMAECLSYFHVENPFKLERTLEQSRKSNTLEIVYRVTGYRVAL